MWSLIAVEQLWLQEVKADLSWLHSLTVARSTRPAPEDNPDYWHDLILNHTGAWKGLLKKARQHILAILQREHHVRQWHADLGPILDEAGVSWNQAPDAESLAEQAVHPCLACRTCFLTKAAWSVHAFKIHGRVAPTRHQAEGNVCDACGKLYLSNPRLSLHLAYSDACWQLLRRRGLCVPPGPGAGSRLNRAQEEDDRCPWLQTMGPRDLRPLDQDRHLTFEQETFMKQLVDLEILHLHAPDAETYPSVEEWTEAFRQQCLLSYLHMDDFKIVFSYYQAEFEDGIPDAGPLRIPYLDFAGALTTMLHFLSPAFFEPELILTRQQKPRETCTEDILRHLDLERLKDYVPHPGLFPRFRQPIFLHLFSGRRRPQDLQQQLEMLDWTPSLCPLVISIDVMVSEQCNLMSDQQRAFGFRKPSQARWTVAWGGHHAKPGLQPDLTC